MDIIENKINDLNKISDWNIRIKEIKEIKNIINNKKKEIDNLIDNIDNKIIIKKEYDINKIIKDFDKYDIDKKIKYYQYINSFIHNLENELFE
jgi:hypothetical protein